MAAGCVAIWGNDLNAGTVVGSEPTDTEWRNAKRTLQGAKDAGFDPIFAKGWFNEAVVNSDQLIAVNLGDVIIDGQFLAYNSVALNYNRCVIRNSTQAILNVYALNNSIVSNILHRFDVHNSITSNNVIHDCDLFANNQHTQNNTIHKTNCIVAFESSIPNNSIISNSAELKFTKGNGSSVLFINSAFEFTGGTGVDETTFTYPTGADDDARLQNLKDRMAIAYGGSASSYLIGCRYYSGSYNDIFIDADNGDFNLIPGCIASNMAYDGSHVGAKKQGVKINWVSEWTNLVNLTTEGKVIDQTLDASATSVIKSIGAVRKITSINQLGNRAARNGVQINTESNLGTEISAGSGVLTDGSVYVVRNNSITRDDGGATAQIPFDTFTALDEGAGVGLGFSGTGVVREVLIEKYDSKAQFKFHKTDNALITAATITLYTNSPILVNADSNGNPTYGNADTGYVEGNGVDLFSDWYQEILLIKADQLAAR